ncbi:hypothetical protein PSR1_00367 [Anaeromyxobacter sp. PSR-1]|nr:hypothetical protein PSR1_00367 [Anaeromyxobacter sp. PSR-1]
MVGRQEAIEAFLAAELRWRLVREDGGGATTLEGPAIILGPTDKQYLFDLRIEVPRSFPSRGADPVVVILKSPMKLGMNAHVGGSGALCVQMPPAHEIDYEREGLVGFFQQVLIHLRRAVIYALVGKYPGPAYAHAEAGQKEFRDELVAKFPLGLQRFVQPGLGMPPDNQWCPCGSKRRLHDCHKAELKAARAAYVEAGGRVRVAVRERLKKK